MVFCTLIGCITNSNHLTILVASFALARDDVTSDSVSCINVKRSDMRLIVNYFSHILDWQQVLPYPSLMALSCWWVQADSPSLALVNASEFLVFER
jgi:hypothetical protein